MADLKISAATLNPSPAGTDNFATDKAGVDFRTTLAQIIAAVAAGDVFKVGTPLVNELGVWTGDGTIRGFAGFEFDGSQFTLPNYSFPVADGAADQVLSTDGAGVLSFKDQAPGGGLLSVKYLFDTTTTAADPGPGNIRFNNATPASVTAIYIDAIDENALDVSNILNLITTNDRLYIQSKEDATEFLVFNVTAPITDNTGWFTIAGTVEASGNLPANGEEQLVVLQIGGAATGGGDVFKVGTPANDQLPVWTGDGTIEASPNFNVIGASLQGVNATGPAILNEASSLTNPTICPTRADLTSGVGATATGEVHLIGNSVTGLTIRELNGGVLQVPASAIAITAFATGGQASAVTMWNSYNVISVCATAGDSVKLPSAFGVGSIHFTKNDGAESCDVFPANGDDLGAGVDTAISLEAGKSIAFIGTVASTTWTQLMSQDVIGITAIVQDLSPQLGADLDTNGFNITNLDTTLLDLLVAAGSDGSGNGGTLTLRAGASGGSSTRGGSVSIEATNGAGGGAEGGDISLLCGNASGSGDEGGDFLAMAGNGAGGGGSNGGNATIEAGRSVGGGIGGIASVVGGVGGNGANTGGIGRVIGGFGGDNGGDGGDAEVTGGPGVTAASDGDGGDVVISGGLGAGTGVDGDIIVNLSGAEFARFRVAGLADQFILHPLSTTGGVFNAPSLQFGSSANGLFSPSLNVIGVTLAATHSWNLQPTQIVYVPANGPGLINGGSVSGTVPSVVPNHSADPNTGLGWFGADSPSLIGGGVELARGVAAGSGGLLANNAATGAGLERVLTTSDLAPNDAAQARRTTNYVLTTAFVDVTMDVTDIETDAAVINHDIGGNTDNIIFGVAGTYEITYDMEVICTAVSGDPVIDMGCRVRLNDLSTGIAGSHANPYSYRDGSVGGADGNIQKHISNTFLVTVAATDFITLQLDKTEITGTATFNVSKICMKARRLT